MAGSQLERLISLREAARVLGVHHSTLSRAVKRGQLKPAGTTPGGWARFRLTDIRQLKDAGVTGSARRRGDDGPAMVQPSRVVIGEEHQQALSSLPELARRLVGADYAAVTVLSEEGRVVRMYYAGIDDETARRIGPLPTGKGVLGVLGPEDSPLRLDRISDHPKSSGFPAHHPPMEALLGVRVTGETVRANLYVANSPGRSGFTLRDEELVRALAAYARLALINEELLARESVLRRGAEVAGQRFQAVLRGTSAGVLIVEPDGRVVIANDEARRIFAQPLAPGTPPDVYFAFPRYSPDGTRINTHDLPLSRVLSTKAPVEPTELVIEHPDGTRIPFLATAAPVMDSAGNLVSAVSIFQDLSRIKEAQRQLDAVVRGISAGVLVAGLDGEVVYASSEAKRLLGLPLDAGTPRSVYEGAVRAFRPDGSHVKQEELPISHALRERRPNGPVELIFQRPDGRRIHVLTSAAPVFDFNGRLANAVAVFQDLARMKELDQVKQEFFSMVTHDLRTPVSTIKGMAKAAMEESGAGPHIATYLDAIDDEADHLTELISNFLDMSRIEAGANIFEFETCHMTDLVSDAVRRARRSRLGAEREITADIPVGLPPLYADPQQVGRVLDNLLSNALKYSDGPVRVRSFVDGARRVCTEVSDQGEGIPASHMDLLFSKFFRVQQGARRGREGAGLGLAICKAIIEAHHGDIGVRSREREGSTFWFALPSEQDRAS